MTDFFERTFLYQVASEQSVIHGLEPIFNALSKTGMNYNWMSQDIQREWRTFFLEYSGMELAEKLIGRDVN